jgi:hypothetical protein
MPEFGFCFLRAARRCGPQTSILALGVELLDAHATRIDARNPEVNAIVVAAHGPRAGGGARCRRDARARRHTGAVARRAVHREGGDRGRGSAEHQWLSLLLAGRVAVQDAEVIRRMRRAGAIPLGTTDLSEFSAFWTRSNLVCGTTRNPYDPARSARWVLRGSSLRSSLADEPVQVRFVRPPAGVHHRP